jgi:hypothetical protein
MRKEKALISLLQGLVEIIGEEAARNPEFADKLEILMSPVPDKPQRRKQPRSLPPTVETPDIYAEWRTRGEQEFRVWLSENSLEILRALIKQHELDPSRRTSRWKEPEKLSSFIADQLQSRLSRGSRFMRG